MDSSPSPSPYQRILLKLSGESFGSQQPFEMGLIEGIARQIKETHQVGKEIGIVVGGGNILRGAVLENYGISRNVADYMGMMGTVINSLALQNILSQLDLDARVMTARSIEGIGETYRYERCQKHLKFKRIVIFAGGTGSPYFSTDTAAALKAVEIQADILLKATKVDGVYTGDPQSDQEAKKFDFISYEEMLTAQYRVIDSTAVAFCRENRLPVRIFNLMKPGNLKRALSPENQVGTLIAACQPN